MRNLASIELALDVRFIQQLIFNAHHLAGGRKSLRLSSEKFSMRIAIVHHWFVTQGGGERVAEVIGSIFPEADLFTLVADPSLVPQGLAGRRITASLLQRVPGGKSMHRHLLPLYPLAVEQLDLTAYDLVLSSDSGPMKGVITRQDAIHICYCHSPMRYLWDSYHSYAAQMSPFGRIAFSLAAHYVRSWDYQAAQRVTHFIANSEYVARRISHYYRRASTVIHPPIDTERAFIAGDPEDYYLAVGRLVSYKRTEILIEACNKLGRQLRIVGDGPEIKKLRAIAGPTIRFLGKTSASDLWRTYAHCRALLFAADEDFGMVSLEAQACGRPVVAYGKGGSLETVCGYPDRGMRHTAKECDATGIFFYEQTADAVVAAILRLEAVESQFSPQTIQRHARQFDTSIFIEKIRRYVSDALAVPYESGWSETPSRSAGSDRPAVLRPVVSL
jgi:glycosyltransferase involved in cell wall biosynthesis